MFKIRFQAPQAGDYEEVDGVDVADAVGNFLETKLSQCLFVKPENGSGSGNETAYFAVVDVEGTGELVGRHFYSGIGRKGGVKIQNPRECRSLAEVEKRLGLTEGSLSDCAWEGEESVDSAWNRKFGRHA